MAERATTDVTQLLIDWCSGDQEALVQLMPLVYDELHRQAERFMRRERRDHTLQPTALVNEAFLQLVDQNRVQWQNRAQFFGVAAQLMRRIVLKHARRHNTVKRGGQAVRVPLDEALGAVERHAAELIALDEALDRLAAFDPRQAKIVELRYYGGLTIDETAACLEISTATVKREARIARAWLQREMQAGASEARA
ncbi:MAG: sigma-70 family RNA polymerase sigma factor [Acidobacteria bacterium]|nr:MAG: sigma-70 family RNA polymerase sigma factor [Acidobacteriota bacterium]